MEALTLLFTSLGTAAGVGGPAAAATGAKLFSTVVSGLGQISAARYNAAVLRRNQAIEENNARRVRDAGAMRAQDADFEAAAVFGDIIATQGASGFRFGSGSFQARRSKNRITASINRGRIYDDASIEAQSTDERARAFGEEARFEDQKGFFALLSMGGNLGSDLISGANLNSKIAADRLRRAAPNVDYRPPPKPHKHEDLRRFPSSAFSQKRYGQQ